jgi:hypothetical protein
MEKERESMSEHIEDYSHLVQQVELRHGIDRKGATNSIVEASSISWIPKRKAQGARRAAKGSLYVYGIGLHLQSE